MIDINELRRLAQAATPGPDGVSLSWIRRLQDFQQGASPAAISELLDRLEAAEKDVALKERIIDSLGSTLNAMTNERDALRTENAALVEDMNLLRNNNTALRAKVEAMEKQESGFRERCTPAAPAGGSNRFPLYALPGAQQCKNCNGMGDRFDPSGEKIPCDLCESRLEEIRSLVAEAAHDIISGSDFWLSISLAAKKLYALPGAKGE